MKVLLHAHHVVVLAADFAPKGFEAYSFGDPGKSFEPLSLMSTDGRLDADGICQAVPNWKSAGIWFCGPAAFGDTLRATLGARGLDSRRFHQELFDMR